MPKRLKKLGEELLHTNPWWQYKHDTYEQPNGAIGNYYYGETTGVVMIVPVLPDGRIVLTLQHRYLRDRQSIEFPAGGIIPQLGTMESAQKELLEETGCIADEYVQVGIFEPCNGLIKDETHVFLAYVVEQGTQQTDATEEIELVYRWPADVDEMMKKNEIWDGQTLAAWTLIRERLLEKER